MRKTVVLVASLAVAVLLAGGAASAALSNLADAGTVNVDGQVRTILEVGNRVYIGGDFTSVDGVARNRLAAIDATTGELDPTWNPNANANVWALAASPDGSRIYAGGNFTSVGGLNRAGIAAIDATTGAPDAAWRANTNSTVRALAVRGNRVYAGGNFTTIKGQSRTRLALLEGLTGDPDPNWTPAADGLVWSLGLSADGSRLYAGGQFASVSGGSRPYLASLDAATGAPDTTFRPPIPNGLVFAMAVSGGRVYAAEGGPGGQAAAYDAATGARSWRYAADGDVQGVTVLSGKVYLAGHFESFAGRNRRVFAAVDASTGVLDPNWAPTADPSWPGVWVLSTSGRFPRIYAGGDFTRVSGEPHLRFAQFTDSSGTPVDTAPPETAIDAGPPDPSNSASVSLSFSSSEAGSTFECSMDGAPFAGCVSPKAYAGLSDGPHAFRVRATDPAGNADSTPAERTWTVQAGGNKVEAETMAPSGSSVVVHSASAASGGKDLAFYSNGSASKAFDGTATRVVLRARGTACDGVPRLKVYVDGALKGTVDLTSSAFADHTLALDGLSGGAHTLRVSHENDHRSSTCDRNAYLDYYALA